MELIRKIDRTISRTYHVVRNQDNYFLHVLGVQGRWTITPYDATLFESEDDASAYLVIAELGDYQVRVVPITWACLED